MNGIQRERTHLEAARESWRAMQELVSHTYSEMTSLLHLPLPFTMCFVFVRVRHSTPACVRHFEATGRSAGRGLVWATLFPIGDIRMLA